MRRPWTWAPYQPRLCHRVTPLGGFAGLSVMGGGRNLCLDCGAVIFSLLGIGLARLGRRASLERVLVIACALGSGGMNVSARYIRADS